tara:strand:- start:250 stop:444 length:195 start_codon:yes stop_codon:yes gene_type:complete
MGVWHMTGEFRSKSCRYCRYTIMQNFIIDDRTFDGEWTRDTERMTRYNGSRGLGEKTPQTQNLR